MLIKYDVLRKFLKVHDVSSYCDWFFTAIELVFSVVHPWNSERLSRAWA